MIRVCVAEVPVLPVIVIQSLLLVAVRIQPAGDAVMVKVRPDAPFTEAEAEAGDSVTEVHTVDAGADCVTVNMAVPMAMVALRPTAFGLGSTE